MRQGRPSSGRRRCGRSGRGLDFVGLECPVVRMKRSRRRKKCENGEEFWD